MIVEERFISADEFLELAKLPEYQDRPVELVEGELIDMPFANPIHARVLISLSSRLNVFVEQRALGQVVGGDAPFILEKNPDGRDTLRGIDIAYLSFQRFPGPLTADPLSVAPDLAVEIVSPSNTAADIRLKIHQLFEAGATLIWIVYPELKAIDVHTLDGAYTLAGDDTLTGGDVLPGFEMPVSEIFPA